MRLNVSGHHVEITDSLRKHALTKLEKLAKHFDRINKMKVIV